MTYNSTPNFWNVNKASVFIDAMNAANSQPRHLHYPPARELRTQHTLTTGTSGTTGNRWQRRAVTFASLAIFAGLMVANWIA